MKIYPLGASARGIAEKLKQARLAKHLSQGDVAKLTNMSLRTIQRAESGEKVELNTTLKLAKKLGINLKQSPGLIAKKTQASLSYASGYDIIDLEKTFPGYANFSEDCYALQIEAPIEMELIKPGWTLILSTEDEITPGDLVLNFGGVGPQFIVTGPFPLKGESHKVVWIKTK